MSTPIIQNLIPSLRETVFAHLRSYLNGEGELSTIMESLEFWYDRLRDKEHPELPMWQDVPSNEQDQLFDAWHDAMEEFWRERLTKSDPVTSPLPVSVAQEASSAVPAPLVPEVVKVTLEALETYQKALAALFMGPYKCAESVAEGLLIAQGKGSKVIGELRNYSPAPSPSVELLRDMIERFETVRDLPCDCTWPEDYRDTVRIIARTSLSKLNAALA